MSLQPPPTAQPPGTPVIVELPADTTLHRVHTPDHDAHTFNPTPRPTRDEGGRFDALVAGAYAYTYLGADTHAALAETICRDLPLGGLPRLVPWKKVQGKVLTEVVTTRPLRVLDISVPACTHVGAGAALTMSEAREYETTRAWAQRLQDWMPDIDGLTYRCRHDHARIAYVLFEGPAAHPRAAGSLTSSPPGLALTSSDGLTLVREVLHQHNATLI